MADIFMSYASEDREQIEPLVKHLVSCSYSVWWDRHLVAGPSFDEIIEAELAAAGCVIVVWSENSIRSRWCRAEATEGLERDILVPVCIDDARPPLAFRASQTASLQGWPNHSSEIDMLISGVDAVLKNSAPVPSETHSPGSRSPSPPTPVEVEPEQGIAVLPFTNLSNDVEQDFFIDGITDDILNGLVRATSLKVIGRSSASQFKDQQANPQFIGAQLGVSHILTGSVRRSPDKMRVSSQLIATSDGSQVWSNQFERDFVDVFAVQDAITHSVLNALEIYFTPRNRPPTDNPAAYAAFVEGRWQLTEFRLDQAIAAMERAVALDPEYADAHADIAGSLQGKVWTQGMSVAELRLTPHEGHLETALLIDPNHAGALTVAAALRFFLDRQFQNGIDQIHEVLCASPNDGGALSMSALMMRAVDRSDLMLQASKRVLALDPFNPHARRRLIDDLLWAGQWDEAEMAAREIEKAGFGFADVLAKAAFGKGDREGVNEQLQRPNSAWSTPSAPTLLRAQLAYDDKDFEAMQAQIALLEPVVDGPFGLEGKGYLRGQIGLLKGYLEPRLEQLERSIINQFIGTLRCPSAPCRANESSAVNVERLRHPELYADPRFQQILERYGLDRESILAVNVPPLPF